MSEAKRKLNPYAVTSACSATEGGKTMRSAAEVRPRSTNVFSNLLIVVSVFGWGLVVVALWQWPNDVFTRVVASAACVLVGMDVVAGEIQKRFEKQ